MKSDSLVELKSRFENINRLLKDVYGKRTRLSHILAAQGEPSDQITKWQQNREWLLNFLTGFETNLIARLTKNMSEQSVKILNDYYGLKGNLDKDINQIASEIRISVSQTENKLKESVKFLRTREGHAVLEKAVQSASKTAHYITVELDNVSYIWTGSIWVEAKTFIHPPEGVT